MKGKNHIKFYVLFTVVFLLVMAPAAFGAVTLESYSDSDHTTQSDSFASGATIYMMSLGLNNSDDYYVAYYAPDDTLDKLHGVSSNSTGGLSSSCAPGDCDAGGDWNVQIRNQADGFPCNTYDANCAGKLANDTFNLAAPEFPAGTTIALLSSILVYAFLRKKAPNANL